MQIRTRRTIYAVTKNPFLWEMAPVKAGVQIKSVTG